NAGSPDGRFGDRNPDLVLDGGKRSVLLRKPHVHAKFKGIRSSVGHFTHAAPCSTPDPLPPGIAFAEDIRKLVTSPNPVEEEESIAQIALSDRVRADEDRERAQFESRILEVLESFEEGGLDHDAQLPRGQWPLHSLPASF